MPASDEAQYDRRRLQNRESQRRYRHRKEQASQVFDVSLTAPERPTRGASSTENHEQAQVPSAAAAAVVVSQFQKENQAAWDGKVAAKGAVFCESSNQYQFEMPESPMDVLSDHAAMPLTVRYKESKSREASDPMLYPPKGPEYPLMYSFPFESGEPSEAADTFILPSSSGKEAAAEEMPRMETGRFSVERIEATDTASPPARRLEDVEATADAAHGLRQTRPVSTARTQYMGMTPQATPRQLDCVDDARMPKNKRLSGTDSSNDERLGKRQRVTGVATRSRPASCTKVERMITEVERLYSFGVSIGVLPEDRDMLVSLEEMKMRFRSLSLGDGRRQMRAVSDEDGDLRLDV